MGGRIRIRETKRGPCAIFVGEGRDRRVRVGDFPGLLECRWDDSPMESANSVELGGQGTYLEVLGRVLSLVRRLESWMMDPSLLRLKSGLAIHFWGMCARLGSSPVPFQLCTWRNLSDAINNHQ